MSRRMTVLAAVLLGMIAGVGAPAQAQAQTGCSEVSTTPIDGGFRTVSRCTNVGVLTQYIGVGATADEARGEVAQLIVTSHNQRFTCSTVAYRAETAAPGHSVVLRCTNPGGVLSQFTGTGSTLTAASAEARALLALLITNGYVCDTPTTATRAVTGGYAALIQCTTNNGFAYSFTGNGVTLTDAAQDARGLVGHLITARQRCTRTPVDVVPGGLRSSLSCTQQAGSASYTLSAAGDTLTDAAADSRSLINVVYLRGETCRSSVYTQSGGYRVALVCQGLSGGSRTVNGTGATLTQASRAALSAL